MDLEPQWVAINSSHVFAASRDNFLLWHYITPKTHSTLGNAGSLRSIMEKILLYASLNKWMVGDKEMVGRLWFTIKL